MALFLAVFLAVVDHLVDSLVLQCRIEGLRPGVRPAHPGSSHRGASAVSLQVPGGGVLAVAARGRWRRVLAAGLRGLAGPGSARAVRTASGLTSASADSGWSFPIRFHPHRPRTVLFPPLSEKHQAPHPCPRQTTPRQQAAPPVSASPHPSSWATPAPPRDHYTQGPRHHAGPDRPGPGPVPRTTNKVTGSWGQTLRKSQGLSASTHSGGQPSTPGGVHSGGETCGLSAGFSPPVGGPVENNAVVFPQVCAQLWMNHSGVLPQIHSLEQTCG